VVILNVALTPPIVKDELVCVKKLDDDICLMTTLFPLFTVPVLEVKAPPSIEYSPEAMLMVAAELMPATMILFELITVLSDTLI